MRKATLQNAGTKGVLDERLRERIDLTHYWNGFRVARNTTVRQLGGWMRRPGTMLAPGADLIAAGTRRRLRRRLQPVQITSGMLTIANGGTAANLVDQDASTDFVTNSASGATFVMAEVDLGAATVITFVDVLGFKCATSGVDSALAVEYYDGANWIGFGARQHIRSAATRRSRRFGFPPGGPGGVPVSTRYLRFVLYGAAGAGAFTISGVRAWKEKRALSPDRLITFARAADTKYELELTDRNIDVFKDHRWVAAIPVPIDASQVRHVTWAQSLDTLHVYHEDVWTRVITRMGSDIEWNDAGIVFANVPTLSPATAFSADTNEVQQVSLTGIVTGQKFVLWIDDEVTPPVTFSGTGSLASDIATALGALPAVASNPTVVLTDATTRTVQVSFVGDNGARRWAPAIAIVLDDDVLAPETKVLQRGIDADGAFASKQTGWPRCGVFEQSRHRMGGFRSAPLSIVTSRSGNPYDLQTTGSPITADLGFIDPLESDQNETIYRLFIGKHTQACTESGVWFQSAATLDATTTRGWRLAARPGVEPTVPVVFLDDATLYMQSGERKPGAPPGPSRVMRELVLVSAVEAQYVADPKNVLAPRLISDAVDIAVREPRTADEPARALVSNADGTIAHLATQRAQEVVGFFPWDTEGKFRSVAVDVNGNMWVNVERETESGGADVYLERFDADTVLDATIVYELLEPTSTLTGLLHLAGKANVWAYLDGDLWGPLTVSAGGECTLPVAAGDSVSIGLMSQWRTAPMPLRDKLTERQPFRPPARIYEMGITVQSTGPIDLSVNGGPAREVPVTYLGDKQRDGGPFQSGGEMDLPLLERLFTGTILMQGLRGWSKHPTWELSQSKPAPVEIVAVRSELAFKG